ncbi:hypothetical protein PENTCL1PPCAC_4941, partial [Pristionchus entomophagus]
FFCDICRLSLPSSRHFRLHLLSEAHDNKTRPAPDRLAGLYNPLSQMICFIDAVTLLNRKKQKKIEKKEEKLEDKVKKEKNELKSRPTDMKKIKEIKGKSKKKTKAREEPLVVVDESENSPFEKDKRGFLVYRMGH